VWVESWPENDKCRTIEESCDSIDEKNMCETEGAAISEEIILNCFWLYSSLDGDSGSCKAKNDLDLSCRSAQKSSQCPADDVTNLRGDVCFWVEGDLSRDPPVSPRCEKKVFKNNIIFFFSFFFFFFFFWFFLNNETFSFFCYVLVFIFFFFFIFVFGK
jgi:hypothetical protein